MVIRLNSATFSASTNNAVAQDKNGKVTVLRFDQAEVTSGEALPAASPASAKVRPATVLFNGRALPRLDPPKAGVAAEVQLTGAMIFRRFEVSTEELAGCYRDITDPLVLSTAQVALTSLNREETECERIWSTLGVPEQERFADLSQRLLSLSSAVVFEETKATVEALAMLVRGPEADQKRSLFFRRAVRAELHAAQTRPAVLARVNQVNQCWKTLRCQLPEIGKIGNETAELERRLRKAQTDIDVATVMVRWLAGHCRVPDPVKENLDKRVCAAALERRTDSLQVTRLTILQAFQQIEILKRTLAHFAEISSEALVNLIPAWCGSCAAILARDRSAMPGPAIREAADVGRLRLRILSVLGKAGTANGSV